MNYAKVYYLSLRRSNGAPFLPARRMSPPADRSRRTHVVSATIFVESPCADPLPPPPVAANSGHDGGGGFTEKRRVPETPVEGSTTPVQGNSHRSRPPLVRPNTTSSAVTHHCVRSSRVFGVPERRTRRCVVILTLSRLLRTRRGCEPGRKAHRPPLGSLRDSRSDGRRRTQWSTTDPVVDGSFNGRRRVQGSTSDPIIEAGTPVGGRPKPPLSRQIGG